MYTCSCRCRAPTAPAWRPRTRFVRCSKKKRIRAPDPDPPPSTPGLSPGTRVRQPLCAQPRATVVRQRWQPFDDTAKHTGNAISCIASSAPSTPRRSRVSRHGCYKGFRQRSAQLDAPGQRRLRRPDTGRGNHRQHALTRYGAQPYRIDGAGIFSRPLRCNAASMKSEHKRKRLDSPMQP
ncbi:hypothetical protein XbrCFBP1976_16560 [Xanthomonas bromi]|uniref:Uncharacterized protein n=1 Tax=Xanthomonas bromi TaxID=56449 RepID=A0ABX5BLI6_9XANT|nr:hypothetical protein XbrCFBP1976_16560 [Xanthomonas bromi]